MATNSIQISWQYKSHNTFKNEDKLLYLIKWKKKESWVEAGWYTLHTMNKEGEKEILLSIAELHVPFALFKKKNTFNTLHF